MGRLKGRRWAARTVLEVAAAAVGTGPAHPPGAILPLRRPLGQRRDVIADDGTQLHCRVLGRRRGPTFVLTHGLCCDHRVWHDYAPTLGRVGRVVVWDLRGHGGTPAAGELSPARFARDLAQVVERCARGPVVLVGHSLGGLTTLRYLLDGPAAEITAAVLIATPAAHVTRSIVTPRGPGRLEAALAHRLIERIVADPGLDRRFVSGSERARARGARLVRRTGFGPDADPRHVALIHDMIATTPTEVRRACLIGMRRTDLTDQLGAITVPTLVVIGARDRLVNPAHAREVARRLPRAHVVTYRRAGHAVVVERAEDIARRVALLGAAAARGEEVDPAALAAG